MDLPNIKYNGDISKFVTTETDSYESILYYKDTDYFIDSSNYTQFIKAVERLVRTSDDYAEFLKYVKEILGLRFCMVSSHITSDMASLEMHHGPIFTLWDICEVILNYFIKTGKKINTFRVADHVLQEHFDLRVQVIMLTITNHEAVSNRDLFLHFSQGVGDVDAFIKMYTPYLQDDQKYKIWNFLNLCDKANFGKSFDRGYLDVDYVKKYIQL